MISYIATVNFCFKKIQIHTYWYLLYSQEFVVGLSVLARGTMTERLEWAFNLYDINGDGLITREEMLNIISAIYELMGRFCEPSVYENTTRDHVEMVFKVCRYFYTEQYEI